MAGKKLMNINLDTLIEMIDSQLTLSEEDNSQSIYKVSSKLRINKKRSGDMTQLLNEVRGIKGVTTVNHKADYARDTDTFDFVIFEIKFELIGKEHNPIQYIKSVLIPNIRKILGVDVQDIQSRQEKLS